MPCSSRRRARGMDGRGKMQNEDRPLTVRCAPALNAPLTRVRTHRRICSFFPSLSLSRSRLLPGGVLFLFIFSFFSRACASKREDRLLPWELSGMHYKRLRGNEREGSRESGTKATSQIYRKLCVVQQIIHAKFAGTSGLVQRNR